MKRILSVLAAIAAFAAVAAAPAAASASATPDSSTTQYYVCSPSLGCIGEPGHNNVVYVRSVRDITLNLVYQETTAGYAWYQLRYNGTNECLNYSPATGFVYEDSCVTDDPNEMWEHHFGNLLGNFASGNTALSTCNDTSNSRLIASPIAPTGCNITSSDQYNWEFIQA